MRPGHRKKKKTLFDARSIVKLLALVTIITIPYSFSPKALEFVRFCQNLNYYTNYGKRFNEMPVKIEFLKVI